MANENIRIATSIPSLKNKVHTKIEGPTDLIYWYIRFNIPLDESSVSGKTMDVTDTEGYIMRTDISYNESGHMIVITPLDTYEQNRYYLLNISKKVRSAKGQNLRSAIHILFKLLNNQISEYKVLKKNVKTPKPRPRPRDYDQRQAAKRNYPTFDRSYVGDTPTDRLATVNFDINLIAGVIGLLLVIVSFLTRQPILGAVSALICIGGVVHIFIQLRNRTLRSTLLFNKGVRQFNRERYREAEISFKKALIANPENELAEYGLYKVGLYL